MLSHCVFCAVMLAIPCTTFSRARRAPPDSQFPSAIRSNEFPWGVPALSGKDADLLRSANLIMRYTLSLIRVMIQHRIPFIIENPQASMLWMLPELKRLIARQDVCIIDAHFCQWGARWKKPTRLLCFNVDPTSAAIFGKKMPPARSALFSQPS